MSDAGDTTLTREDLAEKLKVTVAWTYKHLARLQRERGFPRPFLPNKWSRTAVDLWQLRESGMAAAAAAPAPGPADDDDATSRRLAENARRVATAGGRGPYA